MRRVHVRFSLQVWRCVIQSMLPNESRSACAWVVLLSVVENMGHWEFPKCRSKKFVIVEKMWF